MTDPNSLSPDPTAPAVELLIERLREDSREWSLTTTNGWKGTSALLWEAADRLASLARELESVKADAERYQHAKSLTEWRSLGRFHSLKMPEIHWPQSERGGSAADQLDKAIDAARALPAPPEEKPHA